MSPVLPPREHTSIELANEHAQEKPTPNFPIGAEVEVIVNDRNRTYHSGIIASAIWHHKAKTWHYRLVANGKKISKRYEACDLRPVL